MRRLFIILLATLIHAAAGQLPCSRQDADAASSWPQQFQQRTSFCVQLTDSIAVLYALSADDTTVLWDIQAALPADTSYFGLGLSELGGMKGADIALFNKSSDGSWQLIDTHATGFVAPAADIQQDVKLLSLAFSNNNTLAATWLCPLVPCATGREATQDLPLAVGMPIFLIWAYGPSWAYHGDNRGNKLISFAANRSTYDSTNSTNSTNSSSDGSLPAGAAHATHPASAGSSASTADNSSISSSNGGADSTGAIGSGQPALLVSANVSTADAVSSNSSSGDASVSAGDGVRVLDLTYPVDIPLEETTYRVMYFKLPDDRKYHILKYEPVVNSPLLHHGVAYNCLPSDEPAVEALLPNLGPYDRLTQGMLCEQFFMTLAANMTPVVFPPVAGLPFGANSTRYLALELHYNNPAGLEGQQDVGSGIRIHYTPNLRANDVGVMTLGQFQLDIPPGLERLAVNTSTCPSGCTSRFRQPVNLLSGFFHMHDLGREIIARHYRNGRELTPLGHLRNFDYAYQGAQEIYAPDAKLLLPGDSLTVQCTFNSTSRTNITRSGPGTRDEMCFYWITYWPAQADMGYCLSVGASQTAICGADVKPDKTFEAFRDKALFANLTAQGTLLQFPGNPAVNSTPYVQQCSNITTV